MLSWERSKAQFAALNLLKSLENHFAIVSQIKQKK